MSHINYAFEQADNSDNARKQGTGLGLAIVNRTITAHAGTVTVTSSCGKGTSFLLLLPIT